MITNVETMSCLKIGALVCWCLLVTTVTSSDLISSPSAAPQKVLLPDKIIARAGDNVTFLWKHEMKVGYRVILKNQLNTGKEILWINSDLTTNVYIPWQLSEQVSSRWTKQSLQFHATGVDESWAGTYCLNDNVGNTLLEQNLIYQGARRKKAILPVKTVIRNGANVTFHWRQEMKNGYKIILKNHFTNEKQILWINTRYVNGVRVPWQLSDQVSGKWTKQSLEFQVTGVDDSWAGTYFLIGNLGNTLLEQKLIYKD